MNNSPSSTGLDIPLEDASPETIHGLTESYRNKYRDDERTGAQPGANIAEIARIAINQPERIRTITERSGLQKIRRLLRSENPNT